MKIHAQFVPFALAAVGLLCVPRVAQAEVLHNVPITARDMAYLPATGQAWLTVGSDGPRNLWHTLATVNPETGKVSLSCPCQRMIARL